MSIKETAKRVIKWTTVVVGSIIGGVVVGGEIATPYDRPIENNKRYEIFTDNGVSPSIPRFSLQDKIHIPKGKAGKVRIYFGDTASFKNDVFVAEAIYYPTDEIHERYGLVQFNVDLSVQSDALPKENENENP